jgi:hypothetical protein
MKTKVAVCAGSMLVIALGGSILAAPASAASLFGECPAQVAQNAKSIADKACKRAGYDEAVITYMTCENNEITYSYACL